ncbi:TetR family transcriptional regulator [Paenibacillus sp. FSL R5-0345]|uniref:TetR/AcrR family transcriptional regulator n=1 Tax=Paenibacillus sp. FSL R5-0345 TaxID=1536770 RepID=UPI0004F6EE39|nr:TetR/AcrR family transcriptional regulator [Paenibacillus sp. FSL R5-0345]AIQ36354.1 TetR family transcriptional regulator [Paenibacillus sp. FSL R5-0345]
MSKLKVDLRILKTRKAIKEAFLMLVQTKGYERITIQDIAEKAMINRNTFYLHYVDKPDLMEKLCQESIGKLNVCINLERSDSDEMNRDTFISILSETFKVIEADIVFFKTMLSQNGYPNFSTYIKEALKSIMLSGFGDDYNNQKMRIGLEYIISGLVGVICMWIRDPEDLLVEEVVEQLSEIHFHNILDLLKRI